MSVWRVYAPEWVTVHTSDHAGETGRAECADLLVSRYQGRVRSEDARVRPASRTYPDLWESLLQLRLPNLKGEYRDRTEADVLAAEFPGSVVVPRWSAEERTVLAYGKRRLAA